MTVSHSGWSNSLADRHSRFPPRLDPVPRSFVADCSDSTIAEKSTSIHNLAGGSGIWPIASAGTIGQTGVAPIHENKSCKREPG
ncbi:hypothetical protein, partial [Mesorhizobium sp. M4B.F.Ca.ET.049.02.1.2]|uniref:hypothetical protein n=1 Tax=Mesorhizobium sp. M4B.F.Ca.ET.049.02.1.2 TaxID=2496752 RepID=UPI001AECD030